MNFVNESRIKTVCPFDDEVLGEYTFQTEAQVEVILASALKSSLILRNEPLAHRLERLKRVASALRVHKEVLARQITLEMGKPIKDARSEVEKSAATFEYYALQGHSIFENNQVSGPFERNQLIFSPVGVVLAIMPWNYPLWQLARYMAPALALGNVTLLKHSDLVAGFSEKLVSVVSEALGAREGSKRGHPGNNEVLYNLRISHEMAERVIADERVSAVSFTGSVKGGRAVATQAGLNLKKVVLELGGNDPYIVLADADLDLAAEKCATARLMNNGQSCIAAKRFLVDESCVEEFHEYFRAAILKRKRGLPFDEMTDLGPLAHKKFQIELDKQQKILVDLGAKTLLAGGPRPGIGAFFDPIILKCDAQIMKSVAHEELFGPIAQVVSFKTLDEAVSIANDSPFGLGAAVFTKNLEMGEQFLMDRINSGMGVVNDFLRSDPRVPFGGIKNSGFGRELGLWGALEFSNIRFIGTSAESVLSSSVGSTVNSSDGSIVNSNVNSKINSKVKV